MTGNKLALRLCHSLVDRPKTNAFARVTRTRSPRHPFRRIYVYVASLLGIRVLSFFAVTRITSMSRKFSSIEGRRLGLLIIVVYSFGDHPSTPNLPPEIGFICARFQHFLLLSCHKSSCCSQCRNSL